MKPKQNEEKLTEVGVIVGRFQVDMLHENHIKLIDYVVARHPKVIILLGCAHKVDKQDPLDFLARKLMIEEKYPKVNILPQQDMKDDNDWSSALDKLIKPLVSPSQKVTLYGSRDSFIPHYHGIHPTIELEDKDAIVDVSGTAVRDRISQAAIGTRDFRVGAIWAAYQHYPTAYPTVDCAITDFSNSRVLLVRKPSEKLFRFCGGFVDPKDESIEAAAKRESMEETGVETSEPVYIGSAKIKDWRFRSSPNKIMTSLFDLPYVFGAPIPSDDLKGGEVTWFNIDEIKPEQIVEEHQHLLEMFLKYVENKRAKMLTME